MVGQVVVAVVGAVEGIVLVVRGWVFVEAFVAAVGWRGRWIG